jgi:hypothetical protein
MGSSGDDAMNARPSGKVASEQKRILGTSLACFHGNVGSLDELRVAVASSMSTCSQMSATLPG